MFLKLTLWGYGLQSPLKRNQARNLDEKRAKLFGLAVHENNNVFKIKCNGRLESIIKIDNYIFE